MLAKKMPKIAWDWCKGNLVLPIGSMSNKENTAAKRHSTRALTHRMTLLEDKKQGDSFIFNWFIHPSIWLQYHAYMIETTMARTQYTTRQVRRERNWVAWRTEQLPVSWGRGGGIHDPFAFYFIKVWSTGKRGAHCVSIHELRGFEGMAPRGILRFWLRMHWKFHKCHVFVWVL